jgi:hypothetical protein
MQLFRTKSSENLYFNGRLLLELGRKKASFSRSEAVYSIADSQDWVTGKLGSRF